SRAAGTRLRPAAFLWRRGYRAVSAAFPSRRAISPCFYSLSLHDALPISAVQSMLTMAPAVVLDPPVQLQLRLRDGRIADSQPYTYRLDWAAELSITRDPAPAAHATVTGDSTTWIGVLYEGVPLTEVQVEGDRAEVRRVVSFFTHSAQ